MKRIFYSICLIALGFTFMPARTYAQEFPIAIGSDTTFPGGGAFDGTNFMMGIAGDATSKDNITAQLFSPNGSLVGPRISLGKKGGAIQLAFDGTNYLVVWKGYNWNPFTQEPHDTTSIFGQFISPSGNLTGPSFTIATGTDNKHSGNLIFNDTTYLITYLKGGKHVNYLYGQRISKTGAMIGAPVKISENYAREAAIEFDGTNFLVAWVEGSGFPNDKIVSAQFLSKTGGLVGTNFIVDGGDQLSDNPIAIAFDGSRYLIAFHEQASDTFSRWNLYGRFITTTGNVDPIRITICDSTQYPFLPSIGFDGENYLLTWIENMNMFDSIQMKGRFFNKTGVPIAPTFTIFGKLGNKIPIGGVSGFVNNQYLVGAVRVDNKFTNGDIYGKFIQNSSVGIIETQSRKLLFSIYPNPTADIVTLKLDNLNHSNLTVNIYNLTGALVKTVKLHQNIQQINVHDLVNGIYMVEIKSEEHTDVKKLIINR